MQVCVHIHTKQPHNSPKNVIQYIYIYRYDDDDDKFNLLGGIISTIHKGKSSVGMQRVHTFDILIDVTMPPYAR